MSSNKEWPGVQARGQVLTLDGGRTDFHRQSQEGGEEEHRPLCIHGEFRASGLLCSLGKYDVLS